MTIIARPPMIGLLHVAIHCMDLEACLHFYHDIMGMDIEWQPDTDNIYLTNGRDKLALHRSKQGLDVAKSALHHLGFFLSEPTIVRQWHDYLESHEVMCTDIEEHSDGATSFYCVDPDGNGIRMIYEKKAA